MRGPRRSPLRPPPLGGVVVEPILELVGDRTLAGEPLPPIVELPYPPKEERADPEELSASPTPAAPSPA